VGQPKILVVVGITVVLAVVAFATGRPVIGLVVVVAGGLGTLALLRQEGVTADLDTDDDFLEADEDRTAGWADGGLQTWGGGDTDEAEPLGSWAPDSAAEPLGTWSPEGTTDTLGAWTPEESTDELVSWDDTEFTSLDEAAPLEPEIDTQAEIDFAASLISTPINEDVASADDIMAASVATELHIEEAPVEGDDSELARLLAKVQARLAAYE